MKELKLNSDQLVSGRSTSSFLGLFMELKYLIRYFLFFCKIILFVSLKYVNEIITQYLAVVVTARENVRMLSFFQSVFSHICTEYRKMQTRKNSIIRQFHVVCITLAGRLVNCLFPLSECKISYINLQYFFFIVSGNKVLLITAGFADCVLFMVSILCTVIPKYFVNTLMEMCFFCKGLSLKNIFILASMSWTYICDTRD